MKYTPPDAGGTFEHRGWDCPVHGENVPFFRPYTVGQPIRPPFACAHCNTDWYGQVVQLPMARVYWNTRVVVARGQWVRGVIPSPP